jgi:MYXO-CTERM domain-containing protein
MRARNFAPLLLAAVLAQPTIASAQVDSPTTDMRADHDDRDGLGWLGLLGIVGLFGLRRRDRNSANDVRVARPTV